MSYFFDYLDSPIYVSATSRWAPSWLVPASAVALLLSTAWIVARGVRRSMPALDRTSVLLALGVFFGGFVPVATASLFYRSGKPLLTLTVFAFLFQVLRVIRAREAGSDPAGGAAELGLAVSALGRIGREAWVAGALTAVAGLLDRQGFFYGLIA